MWYKTDELSHHGILGMKWGKRNGPPYPLGASDHSPSEKKAGWRKSLDSGSSSVKVVKKNSLISNIKNRYVSQKTKDYKQAGLSDEAAKEAAEKKVKFIRNALIAGLAVTAVAGGVYAYRQLGRNYLDNVIKAGTTLQTLSSDPNVMSRGLEFYTSHRKMDNIVYKGLYGSTNNNVGKNIVNATVNKDIRIAGQKNATKIFNDMMKNNSEFRKAVQDAKPPINFMDSNNYKNFYEDFNSNYLIRHDPQTQKVKNMFYDALKNKGYAGLADVNDRKYSNFNTMADIIFDKANISPAKVVGTVTPKDEALGRAFWNGKFMADTYSDPAFTAYLSVLGVGSASMVYDSNTVEEHRRKKKLDHA